MNYKIFLFFVFILLSYQPLLAQDTLAYEVQRQRVNSLLDQRSARFGQFDQSLKARTGIFGLKTKKDMQASIDILKEIVATDNNIFKETKVLLEYKDMEKTFISSEAEQSTKRINGYVNTISKLQKNQEEQLLKIQEIQQTSNRYLVISLFSTLAVIILAFLLIKTRNKKR
ncbi:hypothetical protein [Albibacterium bauzanense]|uniref:Uncharacterized protein n=1 Tax=Albibacterium bauzanense TaxID=653929 RepID=A0A4V2PYC6_9SPHI|nr:hypothetical protein [Albibacterium bauzanense]TCK85051.1 hypothetical protein C8N28_0347 [Albibacterium bauzanense]